MISIKKRGRMKNHPSLTIAYMRKLKKLFIYEIQFFKNEIIILVSGKIWGKPLCSQAA
jgi:hypothetical protein